MREYTEAINACINETKCALDNLDITIDEFSVQNTEALSKKQEYAQRRRHLLDRQELNVTKRNCIVFQKDFETVVDSIAEELSQDSFEACRAELDRIKAGAQDELDRLISYFREDRSVIDADPGDADHDMATADFSEAMMSEFDDIDTALPAGELLGFEGESGSLSNGKAQPIPMARREIPIDDGCLPLDDYDDAGLMEECTIEECDARNQQSASLRRFAQYLRDCGDRFFKRWNKADDYGKLQLVDLVQSMDFMDNERLDYDDMAFADFYNMRYGRAYAFEYSQMYRFVMHNLRDKSFLGVVTFGCGAEIDLPALLYAREEGDATETEIRYRGVDAVSWPNRYTLGFDFPNGVTSDFRKESVECYFDKSRGFKTHSMNVFFFPKIVSELSDDVMTALVENIQKSVFKKDQVFVAFSMTDKDSDNQDCRMTRITDAFAAALGERYERMSLVAPQGVCAENTHDDYWCFNKPYAHVEDCDSNFSFAEQVEINEDLRAIKRTCPYFKGEQRLGQSKQYFDCICKKKRVGCLASLSPREKVGNMAFRLVCFEKREGVGL